MFNLFSHGQITTRQINTLLAIYERIHKPQHCANYFPRINLQLPGKPREGITYTVFSCATTKLQYSYRRNYIPIEVTQKEQFMYWKNYISFISPMYISKNCSTIYKTKKNTLFSYGYLLNWISNESEKSIH